VTPQVQSKAQERTAAHAKYNYGGTITLFPLAIDRNAPAEPAPTLLHMDSRWAAA
jgi:hypothetical protein